MAGFEVTPEEAGIVAEFEATHPVRLQTVRPPDASHRGRADAGHRSQRARAPVGGASRRLPRGLRDDLGDFGIRNDRRTSGAGRIFQPLDTFFVTVQVAYFCRRSREGAD